MIDENVCEDQSDVCTETQCKCLSKRKIQKNQTISWWPRAQKEETKLCATVACESARAASNGCRCQNFCRFRTCARLSIPCCGHPDRPLGHSAYPLDRHPNPSSTDSTLNMGPKARPCAPLDINMSGRPSRTQQLKRPSTHCVSSYWWRSSHCGQKRNSPARPSYAHRLWGGGTLVSLALGQSV